MEDGLTASPGTRYSEVTMTDTTYALRNIRYVWEIGLLRLLLQSGMITEQEYTGIIRIAQEQAGVKIVVS